MPGKWFIFWCRDIWASFFEWESVSDQKMSQCFCKGSFVSSQSSGRFWETIWKILYRVAEMFITIFEEVFFGVIRIDLEDLLFFGKTFLSVLVVEELSLPGFFSESFVSSASKGELVLILEVCLLANLVEILVSIELVGNFLVSVRKR